MEVQNVYNSFAQLATQYQEHSGAVDISTSPNVQYAYEDGSANTIRPMSLTYPNGNVLEYLYDDDAADNLSRTRTLNWNGTDVCQYSYLGMDAFVVTDYRQPQIKLDYALGSGSNPYSGFDQFGRVIDLPWIHDGGSSASAASSSFSSSSGSAQGKLVHLQYGYDRASNRTYRADLVARSYDENFDELYTYDGMQRLATFNRGLLIDSDESIASLEFQQTWSLDATGNWDDFTQTDEEDSSQDLDQQRVANTVNEQEDERLGVFVKETFWLHKRRFGARRIARELAADGECCGRKRTRKIMDQMDLVAIQPRSFKPRTTESRHTLGYNDNLLLTAPSPQDRNQVWVGDITYVPLPHSYAYLAILMDLYSRKIVGWSLRDDMTEALVIAALRKAIRARQPAPGLIHHTDRGGQYAGKEYRALLARAVIRQSMSRADNCYDNAFIESCFGKMKTEMEMTYYDNFQKAESEIADFINYYNQLRRHSALDYLSPNQYELQLKTS